MTLLFDQLPRDRLRVKRMKMVDIGTSHVQFICPHCGADTGFIRHEGMTVTEIKKRDPLRVQ